MWSSDVAWQIICNYLSRAEQSVSQAEQSVLQKNFITEYERLFVVFRQSMKTMLRNTYGESSKTKQFKQLNAIHDSCDLQLIFLTQLLSRCRFEREQQSKLATFKDKDSLLSDNAASILQATKQSQQRVAPMQFTTRTLMEMCLLCLYTACTNHHIFKYEPENQHFWQLYHDYFKLDKNDREGTAWENLRTTCKDLKSKISAKQQEIKKAEDKNHAIQQCHSSGSNSSTSDWSLRNIKQFLGLKQQEPASQAQDDSTLAASYSPEAIQSLQLRKSQLEGEYIEVQETIQASIREFSRLYHRHIRAYLAVPFVTMTQRDMSDTLLDSIGSIKAADVGSGDEDSNAFELTAEPNDSQECVSDAVYILQQLLLSNRDFQYQGKSFLPGAYFTASVAEEFNQQLIADIEAGFDNEDYCQHLKQFLIIVDNTVEPVRMHFANIEEQDQYCAGRSAIYLEANDIVNKDTVNAALWFELIEDKQSDKHKQIAQSIQDKSLECVKQLLEDKIDKAMLAFISKLPRRFQFPLLYLHGSESITSFLAGERLSRIGYSKLQQLYVSLSSLVMAGGTDLEPGVVEDRKVKVDHLQLKLTEFYTDHYESQSFHRVCDSFAKLPQSIRAPVAKALFEKQQGQDKVEASHWFYWMSQEEQKNNEKFEQTLINQCADNLEKPGANLYDEAVYAATLMNKVYEEVARRTLNEYLGKNAYVRDFITQMQAIQCENKPEGQNYADFQRRIVQSRAEVVRKFYNTCKTQDFLLEIERLRIIYNQAVKYRIDSYNNNQDDLKATKCDIAGGSHTNKELTRASELAIAEQEVSNRSTVRDLLLVITTYTQQFFEEQFDNISDNYQTDECLSDLKPYLDYSLGMDNEIAARLYELYKAKGQPLQACHWFNYLCQQGRIRTSDNPKSYYANERKHLFKELRKIMLSEKTPNDVDVLWVKLPGIFWDDFRIYLTTSMENARTKYHKQLEQWQDKQKYTEVVYALKHLMRILQTAYVLPDSERTTALEERYKYEADKLAQFAGMVVKGNKIKKEVVALLVQTPRLMRYVFYELIAKQLIQQDESQGSLNLGQDPDGEEITLKQNNWLALSSDRQAEDVTMETSIWQRFLDNIWDNVPVHQVNQELLKEIEDYFTACSAKHRLMSITSPLASPATPGSLDGTPGGVASLSTSPVDA